MRSLTQREYETRLVWIEGELERPSRSDWYAMQVAAEVRRTRVKCPNNVKLSDMKLKVNRPEQIPELATREETVEQAKARWFGFLGVKRRRTVDA